MIAASEPIPVVAKVGVGQGLNRSIPQKAPPGNSLLARTIQLGARATMLLVALQLGSHLWLLGSNASLNVLKPHRPCKPCTGPPINMHFDANYICYQTTTMTGVKSP